MNDAPDVLKIQMNLTRFFPVTYKGDASLASSGLQHNFWGYLTTSCHRNELYQRIPAFHQATNIRCKTKSVEHDAENSAPNLTSDKRR